MKLLLQVIYILVFLINLSVGLIVVSKGLKKASHLTFFILILILNIWIVTNYIDYTVESKVITDMSVRLSFMFGALIVPAFMLFVYYFPKKSDFKLNNYLFISLAIVVFTFITLSFSNAFVKEVIINQNGLNQLVIGDYHWAYSVFIIIFVAVSLSLLTKKVIHSSPVEKLKLRYVLFGFAAASSIGIFFDLMLQPLVKVTSISAPGSAGTIFISLGVGYAILRYRLMDIRIVIRKGFIQFCTFTVLFGIYSYFVIFLQRLTNTGFNFSDQSTLIVAVLIIGLIAEPLRKLVYSRIDKVFSSREADLQDSLKRIQLAGASSLRFQELTSRIQGELSETFPKYEVYMLRKNAKHLEDISRALHIDENSPLGLFVRSQQRVVVIDELPYKIERFTEDEVGLIKAAEPFLKERNIRAILPFGQEGNLIAIGILSSTSSREVLYAEQIDYLKKLFAQANPALVQADMYKKALERVASKD